MLSAPLKVAVKHNILQRIAWWAAAAVYTVTLPWVISEFEATRELMGKNFWPYGIEANRKELKLAMRYAHEQGLVKRHVDFEEMFHPSTLELIDAV